MPRAARGELDGWRETARPCLALVLLLDQFPRNLHRSSGQAFAYDGQAREITEHAVARGFDRTLHPVEAGFLYLPLEHAEDPAAQARCVALFRDLLRRAPEAQQTLVQASLDYALRHQRIIDRFGRFPHRNSVLGRASTPEEASYLAGGGETFG